MDATLKSWSRKNGLHRQDGKPGPITNGTKVTAHLHPGRPRLHEHPWVRQGTMGKVVTTGTADRYNAKKAVGTIDAVEVEYHVPDGVYYLGKRFQVAFRGKWEMEGDQPKPFYSRTEAEDCLEQLRVNAQRARVSA